MFKQEEFLLPYADGKYKVNKFGKVLDSFSREVPTKMIDDVPYVEIDWVGGLKKYPVALVIVVGFDQLAGLPPVLFDRVGFMYKDNSPTNTTLANIVYFFKDGPIEVLGRPGFYYVPFYTSYAIDRNYNLIKINTGQEVKVRILLPKNRGTRRAGYHYWGVSGSGCRTSSLFKHRAICYTFKPYPVNVHDLTVNHRDGDPGHNTENNLEWMTYQENNKHAVETGLCGSSYKPVLVKDLKTGEIRKFASITECSRVIGIDDRCTIRYRLGNERAKHRLYPDYLQLKYDDGSEWPFIDLQTAKVSRMNGEYDIIARNVFTDERVIFTGAPAGEDLLGVRRQAISRHLRDGVKIPIMGWNFQYLDCLGPWPGHTERHLKVYEKHPLHPRHALIAVDPVTNEETFYTSVATCAKELGLKIEAVQNAIQKKYVYQNRLFKLFRLEENLGPPVE